MKSGSSVTFLMRRLWGHLGARRRRQFLLLLGLMAVSVFAEILSIGAVVPFIGILAVPDRALKHPAVTAFARWLGVSTAGELILPLTVAFGIAALVSSGVRLLFVWASTRFTFAASADLSLDIYRRTLSQPYAVHIRRSSSEVISGIATKIGGTVLGVMLPFTVLVSSVLLLTSIIVVLLAIDPFVALLSAGGFGLGYATITCFTNSTLRRNSRFIAMEQTQVIKALQEGLGGIRDVLLDGTQAFYCAIYQRADRQLRRALGTNIFITQSPRPMMEAFGMVLIAGLAFGLSRRTGGIAEGLPVLAALALGAQRLLPALQSAYASWGSIVGSQAVLADTVDLLDQPLD
jgi:ABC-type multidrug transport system fused ATPase/permease subunit